MGRVKLKIKKIENATNRQVTFSKRRNGLIKKACELSVLCDIDVALIMFSFSGKASIFSGGKSIEEILERYLNLLEQERRALEEYISHAATAPQVHLAKPGDAHGFDDGSLKNFVDWLPQVQNLNFATDYADGFLPFGDNQQPQGNEVVHVLLPTSILMHAQNHSSPEDGLNHDDFGQIIDINSTHWGPLQPPGGGSFPVAGRTREGQFLELCFSHLNPSNILIPNRH